MNVPSLNLNPPRCECCGHRAQIRRSGFAWCQRCDQLLSHADKFPSTPESRSYEKRLEAKRLREQQRDVVTAR